jgi:hypothetical protein
MSLPAFDFIKIFSLSGAISFKGLTLLDLLLSLEWGLNFLDLLPGDTSGEVL